jgi:hypothetical protein
MFTMRPVLVPLPPNTAMPVAFNPHANFNHDQRRRNQIMDYYQRVQAEPIALSWQVDAYIEESVGAFKRCCSVLKRRKREAVEPTKTHILKNVRGIVKPGQLCAIMGAR